MGPSPFSQTTTVATTSNFQVEMTLLDAPPPNLPILLEVRAHVVLASRAAVNDWAQCGQY